MWSSTKESDLARHQSSHSSGVLDPGMYYGPGSLKARLCRRGKDAIEKYAADRGIPVTTNGKLVVATGAHELGRLYTLAEGSAANGVAEAA